jgi:hypothetical protein
MGDFLSIRRKLRFSLLSFTELWGVMSGTDAWILNKGENGRIKEGENGEQLPQVLFAALTPPTSRER